MSIISSSKNYCQGTVLIEWDGIELSDSEFLQYAYCQYGQNGQVLEVTDPEYFRGMRNPGTCLIKLEEQ